jgi:hypothetical protein
LYPKKKRKRTRTEPSLGKTYVAAAEKQKRKALAFTGFQREKEPPKTEKTAEQRHKHHITFAYIDNRSLHTITTTLATLMNPSQELT